RMALGYIPQLGPNDTHLSILPLAHCLERALHIVLTALGCRIGFNQGNIRKILDDITELKPSILVGVPRIFNRIHDQVWSQVKARGGFASTLFNHAFSTKKENLKSGTNKHWLWDRLVFKTVRQKFGGNLRIIISGSAPISTDVLDFLRIAFSTAVFEGYGLTETAGPCGITVPTDMRAGNVGCTLGTCVYKLASVPEMDYTTDDKPFPRGEVCVKGNNVFREYYKRPDLTAEAKDADGWLRTGDIGLFDERGNLVIIDRKKNMFKLAQGEYVAPERIENVLTDCPLIEQAFIHGDSLQSQLVAVIVPSEEFIRREVAEVDSLSHLSESSFKQICDDKETAKHIISVINAWGRKNDLKGYEIPKNIHLESEPFSVENDILTPTFKIKRPFAKKHYQDTLDRLYQYQHQQPQLQQVPYLYSEQYQQYQNYGYQHSQSYMHQSHSSQPNEYSQQQPMPPPKPAKPPNLTAKRSPAQPLPGTATERKLDIPAWSTTDPQSVLEGRLEPNTCKVNRDLIDAQLLSRPVPTNAWWQNLIIEAGDQPVVSSPYMVKCVDDAVVICAPTQLAENNFVASVWHDDWRVGMHGCRRHVQGFDPFSVTVKYCGQTSTATVPIVRGSPFTTVLFDAPTPLCLRTIHAVVSVDSSRLPGTAIVQLNDGRTWLICCEAPAMLQQTDASTIVSCSPVQGAVRIALVSNPVDGVDALLAAKDSIPTGASIDAKATETRATFTIQWATRGADSLLLCALPHHQMSLENAHWVDAVGTYWTSKGLMRAVLGTVWQWTEELEPLGFAGQTPLGDEEKAKLRELVQADAATLVADASALPRDPYFFGKAAARATRIALIADEVGEIASRDLAIERAIQWLEPWLDGTNSDPLLYDTEWRGLVSQDGLKDPGADFGQGRYNDHHFHYGYFVYAAAVLAKLQPEWAEKRREHLDLFARDYCNPAQCDSHFPFMRHFDFFDAHSWAAGLFAFADSRNQESTSEAINAYYAAFLYAEATGRKEIARFARAVLQLEARASRVYWHLGDITAHIYPEVYAKDKAIVGILWSSKCDFATFFGANKEFIYGIQFLPYTPATALLVKRQWIEDIWPKYLEGIADAAEAEPWQEIINLSLAVVDRQQAFSRTASVTNHDDGNSASNSYYWIATAP
ncbi:medium-chain fatty acid-CoA ligase faa2, partial [Dipsacomyces acuminosporus]